MTNAVITGTGSYTPDQILTNADLEKIVETSDEWIITRTGIKERRIAPRGMTSSDMACEAARRALEMAGAPATSVDFILVGTVTPDYPVPSTASIVQRKLGASSCGAMDVVAACAGFLYSLAMAKALIQNGTYRRVLAIGVEKLSHLTNYKDRSTCVLFGDGAGVVVVESRNGATANGVVASYLKADGTKTELLWVPVGGTVQPVESGSVGSQGRYVYMAGNEIFKLAVRAMCDAAKVTLDQAGISSREVSWLIPHQANIRIIQAVAERLDVPREKIYINIERYGNTSAASVPIALDEANRNGLIKQGEYVLMVAFGGGLTWAASLVRW